MSKHTTRKKHQTTKEDSNQGKKESKYLQNNQKTSNEMVLAIFCLKIITLNVNGLNFPRKKYRMTEWFFVYLFNFFIFYCILGFGVHLKNMQDYCIGTHLAV